ncbi:688d49a8-3055-4751-8f91-78b3ba9eedf6 [Thermothielavioides terrestris]|uniref:DNA (cytosine-5-)-methyltransferase n=1 Tax=Thermothielavioides terrestris TaxID=2587410 RepID=A0A3S5CW44_9PEZI|nr:688d49a8-3055-4751-8f91-78b3ba9eedf6 [Thermothielavioides terrestris]
MEQTFGLLSPKFTGFFNTMLRDIAQLGCSMRWRVAPLANYGVPQLRRRLIIIGSAPGEKLPPFPPATHSKDGAGGLKRWITPKKVLDKLQSRRDFKLHQPQLSRRFRPPKAPWDPTKLARTITTNGGQNYHWDGERDFTLLEYALLQGFPTWHKFKGGYIKKQIGNAFAPTVVKVLYEHLKKWLLVQDGFDSEARPQVSAGLPRHINPRDCVWVEDDNDDSNHNDRNRARSSSASHRQGQGRRQEEVEEVELPCPGSQGSRSSRRLSEVVRRLNLVAEQEENLVDLMDLDGADELSDTATLRGDDEVHDLMDVEDGAANLVVDGGGGTRDDPYLVVSD